MIVTRIRPILSSVLLIVAAGILFAPGTLAECDLWTWLTHNCAINPKGACCPPTAIASPSTGSTESGRAWHNDNQACLERLETTYAACLGDDRYTPRSCRAKKREGHTFCAGVERSLTAVPAAEAGGQRAECDLWTWLTHNCAINPKGPCCSASTLAGPGAGSNRSGQSWNNSKKACLDRLETTYAACLTDDRYTRQICGAKQQEGETFCDNIQESRNKRLTAGAADRDGDCGLWTWITHNCAINPKGPCCAGARIASRSARPGKAWHNDKQACQDRLESTYAACLKDDEYTRRSCDKNRSKGTSFCEAIK